MQNSTIVISAFCVAFCTLLGFILALSWHKLTSSRFRRHHDIPYILGKWRCYWYDDFSDSKEPKIVDIMEIEKWTYNGEFAARGHQPQFHLSYPFVGEIDPSRVVTLIYKAARYPYEPNRGVVCMELNRNGETMEGRWYGRRYSGKLGGGIVKCVRMMDRKAVA